MAVGVLSQSANAQSSQNLSIISPANETVVQPGQTIHVAVAAANQLLIVDEMIVGTGTLSSSQIQSPAAQLVFDVTIPSNIDSGRYYITAVGVLNAGGIAKSPSVSIIVPVAGTISSLDVSNNPLVLRAPGVQIPLDVTGIIDSNNLAISPMFLTFVSSNPNVATVDVNGVVSAQGPGQAQISVSYTGSTSISTVANVEVLGGKRGDLNGDGRVDTADINILTSLLNTPAHGPNDARDVNHDGVINALDARILVTLCTYPRCAAHP